MLIKKSYLKQVIKEEISKVLKENEEKYLILKVYDQFDHFDNQWFCECIELTTNTQNHYLIDKSSKPKPGQIVNDIKLVNWWQISQYQKLPESFIEKFKEHMQWYYISQNPNIPKTPWIKQMIEKHT